MALEHGVRRPKRRRRRRRVRDLSGAVRGVLSVVQDAGGRLSIECVSARARVLVSFMLRPC